MSGPHPAVAQVRSAVRAGTADLPEGARLVVACSGGADSLALAAAVAWLAPRSGWSAGAVVVDHGLQPGSAGVAERAAAACRDLGLGDAEVVRVDAAAAPGGPGPEGAARAARLEALRGAAARRGAAAVLLGHTRDDQAEQVLLGLARGSGARSLAGMSARNGPLRRPLLGVERATTRAACAALGLRPWDDPANADAAYARSRVRARVMPVLEDELGPGVAAALARTADQLREDAEVLEALAAELLDRAREEVAAGEVALRVAELAAAPAALRRRALRAAALEAGAPAGALTRAHVLGLDALVTGWRGQGPLHLPGHLGARRACGRLLLARRTAAPGPGGDAARDRPDRT